MGPQCHIKGQGRQEYQQNDGMGTKSSQGWQGWHLNRGGEDEKRSRKSDRKPLQMMR